MNNDTNNNRNGDNTSNNSNNKASNSNHNNNSNVNNQNTNSYSNRTAIRSWGQPSSSSTSAQHPCCGADSDHPSNAPAFTTVYWGRRFKTFHLSLLHRSCINLVSLLCHPAKTGRASPQNATYRSRRKILNELNLQRARQPTI